MKWLSSVKNRRSIYWCFRAGSPPSSRVLKLLSRPDDRLVSIDGFDELMVSLSLALNIDIDEKLLGNEGLDGPMVQSARNKERSYREAFKKHVEKASPDSGSRQTHKDLKQLLSGDHEETETGRRWRNWIQVQLEINTEADPDKQDLLYKEGLETFQHSAELAGNYAIFLTEIRKDHDGAERLLKRALELDPNDTEIIGNYAIFLKKIRKDHDGAETLYERALKLDPNDADINRSYAGFLTSIRKDHDGAEKHFKRALELDPKDAINKSNYALFLTDVRKDHDGAETLYKRALELAPNYADIIGNYASLLFSIGRNKDARPLLKLSLESAENKLALQAELQFYRLAHCPEQRDDARKELTKLIAQGANSDGWSFQGNINRAAIDGYPDIPELCRLAEKITGVPHKAPAGSTKTKATKKKSTKAKPKKKNPK